MQQHWLLGVGDDVMWGAGLHFVQLDFDLHVDYCTFSDVCRRSEFTENATVLLLLCIMGLRMSNVE